MYRSGIYHFHANTIMRLEAVYNGRPGNEEGVVLKNRTGDLGGGGW